MQSRRDFIVKGSIIGLGFLAMKNWSLLANGNTEEFSFFKYGNLLMDSKGILNLPKGFNYKIISTVGDKLDDGFYLPGKPDGMATFKLDNERCVVVRNHELEPNQAKDEGAFGKNYELPYKMPKEKFYDFANGEIPSGGGTTNFVYNYNKNIIEKQFVSLIGTNRNCAGGKTPWGTWLTCEEDVTNKGEQNREKNHGYVFEVQATDSIGVNKPIPIKDLGRFNHEAVCVDPKANIIYLTEDRHDGLLYRFIPNNRDNINGGGKLQALAVKNKAQFDTRNWEQLTVNVNDKIEVEWIDLESVDNEQDNLRELGKKKGAAIFARGEGIWFGEGEFYFNCTNGGNTRNGQIFRYKLSNFEGNKKENSNPAILELFIEPNNSKLMNSCDNLTIAPWGDVIICEDTPHPRIIGITKEGKLYPIAENIGYSSEFAGVCFAPDNNTMFVNIQHAGLTLAIKGDW